jgi:hypothetical protein
VYACTLGSLDAPAPVPRGVVRDLLAITGAHYRAERARDMPDLVRFEKLEEIGRRFREALDLGARCEPDTLGDAQPSARRRGPRSSSGRSSRRRGSWSRPWSPKVVLLRAEHHLDVTAGSPESRQGTWFQRLGTPRNGWKRRFWILPRLTSVDVESSNLFSRSKNRRN